MKLVFFLLVVPFVFAGPAKPARRYILEERDPEFKRYIYVENGKGQIEKIDLRDTGNKIAPKVGLSDVQYDLYTPSNPSSPSTIINNNVADLATTNFDPSRLTIFLSHGWNNDRNSAVNTLIRDALFGNHNVNLFVVDWSGPANEFYTSAKDAVVPVGQIVGDFVNLIQSTYGLTGSDFVLIGHSLGAHVAGCAGATINSKVANIIGMDPAGPLYNLNDITNRLDITDGEFVQVIHTNGALLGLGSSIGDADFFPNGGMTQPGCGLDLAGTCAHGKSYRYMAEAISRGASVFRSVLCTDWDSFLSGSCTGSAETVMGDLAPRGDYGDFFLQTNDDEPFGMS